MPLCHCNTCRHVTGILFTSYYPINKPSSLDGTVRYEPSPRSTVYFCATCGCHVFRRLISQSAPQEEGDGWEVASGVLTDGVDTTHQGSEETTASFKHLHVQDTSDGGLSSWIKGGNADTVNTPHEQEKASNPSDNASTAFATPAGDSTLHSDGGQVLRAACHCQGVSFHITRPDSSSKTPVSTLPDLMIAYNLNDPRTANPEHDSWWLCDGDTKYLAGTCACKSCRLISGFEIQTWAFIPRSNIFFHVNDASTEAKQTSLGQTIVPLEFSLLNSKSVLQSYESSPGVLREFCPRCGATVFWHDKWRPELIDVSVGLISAPSGARAEGWLKWWIDRVSFSEETEVGRTGWPAARAMALVKNLEEGMVFGRG